jgi:cell division protein YceG involved in septum cleavage
MVRFVSQLQGVKNGRKKRTKNDSTDSSLKGKSIRNSTVILIGIILFVTVGALSIHVLYRHSDTEKESIVLVPTKEGQKKIMVASSNEYVIQNPTVISFVLGTFVCD